MGKKNITKTIRFTEKEMQRVIKEADKHGQNPSQYMRSCISGGLMDQPEFRKNLAEMTFEVHKIGVNVNQIAYHNNIGMMTTVEKELLFELMKDIRAGILRLVEYGNYKNHYHPFQ